MSLSINESIDLQFQCKGNWIRTAHYVLPNKPMKLNEKLGYCSICWNVEAKDNSYPSNPQTISYTKSFKDSKINPKSGSCGVDTL